MKGKVVETLMYVIFTIVVFIVIAGYYAGKDAEAKACGNNGGRWVEITKERFGCVGERK